MNAISSELAQEIRKTAHDPEQGSPSPCPPVSNQAEQQEVSRGQTSEASSLPITSITI